MNMPVQEAPPVPVVSIVIPTLGDVISLRRCLDSLSQIKNLPNLSQAEIIIFFNPKESTDSTLENLQTELREYSDLAPTRFVQATRYHLTAEESALSASKYAQGKYLWIVGDQRYFLIEGLKLLDSWLKLGKDDICYFNSIWATNSGYVTGEVSTHMNKAEVEISYREFVIRSGHNYMATAFGNWIFKRELLELDIWSEIINECGPHFSHVTALLTTAAGSKVKCFATAISLAEEKKYHNGDNSEWVDYAERANKYRFYPWTLGLVRQFNYLIEKKVFTHELLRIAMCSERNTLKRQSDEIFQFTLAQVRLGRRVDRERLSTTEAAEIFRYLRVACPEKIRTIINLEKYYFNKSRLKYRNEASVIASINIGINQDSGPIPFVSLVTGRFNNMIVRLHPDGFLLTYNSADHLIYDAYRMIDPKNSTNKILLLDNLLDLNFESYARLGAPHHILNESRDTGVTHTGTKVKRRTITKILLFGLHFELAWKILAKISTKNKQKLRNLFL
jgi:hypothetical protein